MARTFLHPALTQPLQVLFAGDPSVRDPHPLGLAILVFHQADHLLQRGHVVAVAGEHLVANGQAFRRDHPSVAHLLAVGTMAAQKWRCAPYCTHGVFIV